MILIVGLGLNWCLKLTSDFYQSCLFRKFLVAVLYFVPMVTGQIETRQFRAFN